MFRRANVTAYTESSEGTRSNAGRGVAQVAVVALLLMAVAASAQPCPSRCWKGRADGFEPNDRGKLCSVDTDCNLCNPASQDYMPVDCAFAATQGGMCQARSACVHLEFRPSVIGASNSGQIIQLKLYAVSSTGYDQRFEFVQAILNWDPTKLLLLGDEDPCTVVDGCSEVCPGNTYKWFSSAFPNDCGADNINEPCPGDPQNDGDALYIAMARICCTDPDSPTQPNCFLDAERPFATPQGLHVTSFTFEVLSDVGTSSEVSLIPVIGNTWTVVSGAGSGEIITGNLPDPALVTVEDCVPPTVLSVGSKVIEIDPGIGTGPVGFLVTSDDPSLTCISRYADEIGELGAAPVFQTPAEWGSFVRLRGRRIMPEATYKIQKDCGTAGSPVLSTPVEATMTLWADTDNNRTIDFKDIARAVSGFVADFEGDDPPLTFADVDLVGITNPNPALSRLLFCVPNDVVDFKDIAITVEAFVLFGDPEVNAYQNICDVDFCDP